MCAHIASTFSSVLTILGLPDDFLFRVDPVARRLGIHSKIVFGSGKILDRARIVHEMLSAALSQSGYSHNTLLNNEASMFTGPMHDGY